LIGKRQWWKDFSCIVGHFSDNIHAVLSHEHEETEIPDHR
jgi:hypothetical protein